MQKHTRFHSPIQSKSCQKPHKPLADTERLFIAWYRSLTAIHKLLVSYMMAYPQMLEEFLTENGDQKDDLYTLLNKLRSFLP